MRNPTQKKRAETSLAVLWAMTVLAGALSPAPGRADSTATDAQLSALCAGSASSILVTSASPGASSSPLPLSSNDATQKQQYCAAGNAAALAAQADDKAWKVYAAAAAVCTAACAASMTSLGAAGGVTGYDGYICTGAAVGASVADAAWTKDYMSAVEAVAGVGVGYAISSSMSPTATSAASTAGTTGAAADGATQTAGAAAKSGGSAINIGACLSAATTAFSAYSKNQDVKTSEQTVQQNVSSLQALESQALSSANAMNGSSPAAVGGGTGGSTTAQSGSTSGITATIATSTAPGSGSTLSSNACSGAGSSGAIQCAATAGGLNMPILSNPGFNNALQNATGMTPAQFMSAAGQSGPAGAIASGLSSMGTAATNAMGGALSAMADNSFGEGSGTYAGRGGAAPSGSGTDIASFMSDFMGKLAPNKGDGKDMNLGAKELHFGEINRALASKNPEEDRSISLFTRVAIRYASLTPRMLVTPTEPAILLQSLPPLPLAK